jgi:hypothetical protein
MYLIAIYSDLTSHLTSDDSHLFDRRVSARRGRRLSTSLPPQRKADPDQRETARSGREACKEGGAAQTLDARQEPTRRFAQAVLGGADIESNGCHSSASSDVQVREPSSTFCHSTSRLPNNLMGNGQDHVSDATGQRGVWSRLSLCPIN